MSKSTQRLRRGPDPASKRITAKSNPVHPVVSDEMTETRADSVLTIDEVSQRFNVSTKTVERWRRRGLKCQRVRLGNRKRIGFLQSSVDRFLAEHPEVVERGGRFSRMTDTERGEIIRRARILTAEGARPAEVARNLGREFNRSAEAIRLTVKNYDQKYPDAPVFQQSAAPLSDAMKMEILADFRRGDSVENLAKQHDHSRASISRTIRESRIKEIWETPLQFIHNDLFEGPRAEAEILGSEPEPPARQRTPRVPAGLPSYLASLYAVPLLSREQEAYHFRKLNYLKFTAGRLRDQLDPEKVKTRDLQRLESLLKQAADIKQFLVRSNLRLVVSIAKKYAKPDSNLFELVSDGNISLMRAIDRFDYSRGFKLSTYATWAIQNNFNRTVPTEYSHRDRFRTGQNELFADSHSDRTCRYEQERTNQLQNEALTQILTRLQDRDREIVASHFGLNRGGETETLEQIGNRLGVSKERVRQLEVRALNKLREIVVEEKLDIPGM